MAYDAVLVSPLIQSTMGSDSYFACISSCCNGFKTRKRRHAFMYLSMLALFTYAAHRRPLYYRPPPFAEQRRQSTTTTADKTARKQILIAQYSGGSRYEALLNLTSPVNQAYALRWGHDYKLVTGFLIHSHLNDTTNIPESRSTYNKVMILEQAAKEAQYHLLLILDSDAMLFDFDRDLANFMTQNNTLLVAHKVKRDDVDSTSNINIGVTLWNLRHPATLQLARRWKERCLQRIRFQTGLCDNDQTPLQEILRDELTENQRSELLFAVSDEFGYSHGRFVKHFIRPKASDWNDTGIEQRTRKIRRAIHELCQKHFVNRSDQPDVCGDVVGSTTQNTTS